MQFIGLDDPYVWEILLEVIFVFRPGYTVIYVSIFKNYPTYKEPIFAARITLLHRFAQYDVCLQMDICPQALYTV